MTRELVWAATDGPAGTTAVTLSEDRAEAIRIRDRYEGQFWCSTEGRGCGGRLTLKAGPQRRPYFSHRARSACQFREEAQTARNAYEHLRYQRAFQEWLARQGYHATLEKVLAGDGRTDLHVVVDTVAHALEIQLSPIAASEWREREARYRRHVRHVSWFYGSGAEAASATELAHRGLALSLKDGPLVGVRAVTGPIRWTPLAECRLTAEGVQAPGLDEAAAAWARQQNLDQQERERQELAQQDERDKAEAAARRAIEQQSEARAREAARRRSAERQRSRIPVGPQARIRPPVAQREPGLPGWQQEHPEAVGWRPWTGWGWLADVPAQLHGVARALTYTTQVLKYSSPTAGFLPELVNDDARGLLFDCLARVGLVRQYSHPSGVHRWERASQPT